MYSLFCLFKQKTAYEMRISDWSSDVCSSDLLDARHGTPRVEVIESLARGLQIALGIGERGPDHDHGGDAGKDKPSHALSWGVGSQSYLAGIVRSNGVAAAGRRAESLAVVKFHRPGQVVQRPRARRSDVAESLIEPVRIEEARVGPEFHEAGLPAPCLRLDQVGETPAETRPTMRAVDVELAQLDAARHRGNPHRGDEIGRAHV